MPDTTESVRGIVDHIIFRNEENGYTVFVLGAGDKELTCVGSFQSMDPGESIEVFGRTVSHVSYGEQFKVERFEYCEPENAEAILRYLGSGAIKGIGMAMAKRIVKRFGDDTLRVIEEEPERLSEVKGISMRKARDIAKQTDEKRAERKAMVFLSGYGVSLALGVRIYRKYGEEVYKILKENPYRLAEEIEGVGFKTADAIAVRGGIELDSQYRIRCGILYVLGLAAGEGSVYLPEEELFVRSARLLGVLPEAVEYELGNLAIERKVILKEKEGVRIVYEARFYYVELGTARMLTDLNVRITAEEDDTKARISRVFKRDSEITLSDEQQEAVACAMRNGLFIMTGGPGTGKTTTINAMLRCFEAEKLSILLAAPTGRAARRMTETTGFEASTIHRLLEISSSVEDEREHLRFERNSENPLEADVVIVDEMSMVDIFLMHALLSAIPVGTRLILVGDMDQLPSVGPGAVLRDIIESGAFPAVRLGRIFRQAAESDIVMNAHRINKGEQIKLTNKSRDFLYLKREDPNLIISNCIELIRDRLPGYVDARPFDIQVLAPMKKGLLGVARLNRILQEYLNPPSDRKAEKLYGDGKFRSGDKVMQVKNNYQIPWEIRGRHGATVREGSGIFNGDTGIIREINDPGAYMTIEFDEGRFVDYPYGNLDELELAYAVTIHKSQGSEYPAVILPLLTGPRMLLTRNLLYTAVTRARKCVMLLGKEEAFRDMIENESELHRYTSLKDRILELQGGEGA
ncbi:MAG: ATP-dependent RecD-like DNA helicase [Lachnospiraceae bacterium]|nr:ATP-dependent RecD-like DNA helicase [Lachnospiraceae bacterium]